MNQGAASAVPSDLVTGKYTGTAHLVLRRPCIYCEQLCCLECWSLHQSQSIYLYYIYTHILQLLILLLLYIYTGRIPRPGCFLNSQWRCIFPQLALAHKALTLTSFESDTAPRLIQCMQTRPPLNTHTHTHTHQQHGPASTPTVYCMCWASVGLKRHEALNTSQTS